MMSLLVACFALEMVMLLVGMCLTDSLSIQHVALYVFWILDNQTGFLAFVSVLPSLAGGFFAAYPIILPMFLRLVCDPDCQGPHILDDILLLNFTVVFDRNVFMFSPDLAHVVIVTSAFILVVLLGHPNTHYSLRRIRVHPLDDRPQDIKARNAPDTERKIGVHAANTSDALVKPMLRIMTPDFPRSPREVINLQPHSSSLIPPGSPSAAKVTHQHVHRSIFIQMNQ